MSTFKSQQQDRAWRQLGGITDLTCLGGNHFMWMMRQCEQDQLDLIVTSDEGIMSGRAFEEIARLDCCLDAACEHDRFVSVSPSA